MSDDIQTMLPFPSGKDNASLCLGILAIEGVDASAFLQGQLTQDVSLCAQGPQMTAALNPKGRAYAQGWLVAIPTGFLWILPQTIVAETMSILKRYILRSKVTLTDVSTNWAIELTPATLNTDAIPCLPTLLQAKTGWSGQLRPVPAATQSDWVSWHQRCLAVGYAMLTPATVAKYTAHELDLIRWEGVSFTKGCYTGQEIVARMHYRATPKTALSLIQLEGFKTNELVYSDVLTLDEHALNVDLVDGQWQDDGCLLALAVLAHSAPETAAVGNTRSAAGQLRRIAVV